ncbi:MAG: hypothetical protein F2817_16730 [Actinobacteria bacterium]|nr:hypothetical protein [Actinomycetota bacterium]
MPAGPGGSGTSAALPQHGERDAQAARASTAVDVEADAGFGTAPVPPRGDVGGPGAGGLTPGAFSPRAETPPRADVVPQAPPADPPSYEAAPAQAAATPETGPAAPADPVSYDAPPVQAAPDAAPAAPADPPSYEAAPAQAAATPETAPAAPAGTPSYEAAPAAAHDGPPSGAGAGPTDHVPPVPGPSYEAAASPAPAPTPSYEAAPAAHAAPVPPQSAAPVGVTVGDVDEQLPGIAAGMSGAVRAALGQARAVSVRGADLVLGVPAGKGTAARTINREDAKEKIAAELEELLGVRFVIRAEEQAGVEAPQEQLLPEDEVVRRVMTEFEAEEVGDGASGVASPGTETEDPTSAPETPTPGDS